MAAGGGVTARPRSPEAAGGSPSPLHLSPSRLKAPQSAASPEAKESLLPWHCAKCPDAPSRKRRASSLIDLAGCARRLPFTPAKSPCAELAPSKAMHSAVKAGSGDGSATLAW